MPLVTLKEILPEARRQKRAVGAFNVANVEAAMGVIRAAEGEKLPAIIQIFQRLFLTEKGSDLAGALLRMAHRCSQPIVVHLDHGGSPEIVRAALAAGTTSVMFDGSTLPFEKKRGAYKVCRRLRPYFGSELRRRNRARCNGRRKRNHHC